MGFISPVAALMAKQNAFSKPIEQKFLKCSKCGKPFDGSRQAKKIGPNTYVCYKGC